MILRITLGSATRSRSRRGTHSQRCGSAQKVSAASADQRAIDQRLELEVGEGVAHHARHRPPLRPHRRSPHRLVERGQRLRPFGGGHLQHAAEQPRLRAPPEQHGSVLAQGQEGEPDAHGPLGPRRPRRQRALEPARKPRNRPAAGTSGRRGACGVHRLAPRSISAWAKSPARRAGVSVAASRLISGLAAGSGVATANSRATTRSMLPSTGVARAPKAMAAIAAAV